MNYLGDIIDNNLIDIVKLSRLVGCSYNDTIKVVAERNKLNWFEANTLLVLSNNKDIINAKDVVNFSKVSKAYVSKSINSLLEKKLFSIEVDDSDNRKQKIIINKSANKVIDDLKKSEKKYLENLVNNIDVKEVDKFIKLYKLLGNNILNGKEDINDKNI